MYFLKKGFTFLLLFWIGNGCFGQTGAPLEGLKTFSPDYYVFENSSLVLSPGTIIKEGMLIIKKGVIDYAGPAIPKPKGAHCIDVKGKWIFPGLIDAWTHYGLPVSNKSDNSTTSQSIAEGSYWNSAIKPELSAVGIVRYDSLHSDTFRKKGFTLVNSLPNDGIVRGSGTIVNTGFQCYENFLTKKETGMAASFTKGSSIMEYPASEMGAIALLRQAFYDKIWYAGILKKKSSDPLFVQPEFNRSLLALVKAEEKKLPWFFEAVTPNQVSRIHAIAKEFGLEVIIKGNGREFEVLNQLKNSTAKWILPVNFPEPKKIESPYDYSSLTLQELRNWEQAPMNLVYFYKAGIPFSITSANVGDAETFWKNIRKSVEQGLPEKDALKALTETPAKQLGIWEMSGSLSKGKVADFFIADGNPFLESAVILQTWVSGKCYERNQTDEDLRGVYSLKFDQHSVALKIEGVLSELNGKIITPEDTSGISFKIKQEGMGFHFFFDGKKVGVSDKLFFSGYKNDTILTGSYSGLSGETLPWKAKKVSEYKKPIAEKVASDSLISTLTYPNSAYGFVQMPEQKTYFIDNATVWTNIDSIPPQQQDVLFSGGKIIQVDRELSIPSEAIVLDGTGLHLTNGIIDEHSHIAIDGDVNEGTQSVTAEVSIGSVINPTDIQIYRQLAGGVTSAQLLHGSANAIGGQSAIVKLRWGQPSDSFTIQDAKGFIKFALGENVKQSNWGDQFKTRYPQTRLGVEQIIKDAFIRAKEYKNTQESYLKLKKTQLSALAPPRDLQSEAILEILEGKRFITCHSYEQGEINMLIKLGDSLGFKVNTFTHGLEAYKVADKIREKGINVSSFSDWWAYKYEVMEAIPQNPALLSKMGVTVAVNSDDAEMGRRLNQEAAKSVKYGHLSETEAWKLVTLNPAKMLHLDHRLGTIESGKDADLVLWSSNPLSVQARVLKTWVDGRNLYDYEVSEQMDKQQEIEKRKLFKKMLVAAEHEPSVPVLPKPQTLHTCETNHP